MIRKLTYPLLVLSTGLAVGCGDTAPTEPDSVASVDNSDLVKVLDGKGDASAEAIFLDFAFEGSLVTDQTWNIEKQVENQMLYTIGQLNGDNSVGRLDKLVVSNIETEPIDGGKTLVNYDATILVGWGDKDNPVSEYTFKLPRDVSSSGLEAFAENYSHDCVDWGAHDVTSGSMWYYYRPARSNCDIAEGDIVEINVAATISDVNTTGKYPEYHKVWEDNTLKVVAVFGKYEDGATTASDAGIRAYDRFISTVQNDLGGLDNYTTEPAEVPSSPGVETPDITFTADIGEDMRVEVVTLLVDNVRTAGPEFTSRYEALTPDADLIVYNGHAGLGSNIRALAQKGRWQQGQYAIVFMNGCDTYAYVDSALADAHADVNPDDPEGTKYLDIVTNAMPSFFREMPNSTIQLIRGLMNVDDPQTYEQMFSRIDADEVVIVSGEHDNEFIPGGDSGEEPTTNWEGLTESGGIAQNAEDRFSTPTLPAGTYTFELSGSGDADLYVRIGNEPTIDSYDCRPFRAGSSEQCVVELSSPTTVHVMVRGWDANSEYNLLGRN